MRLGDQDYPRFVPMYLCIPRSFFIVPATLELLMNNASVGNRIRIIHGNDAEIQCVARGAKPAVTLRWKVNGEEQNADTLLGRSIEEEGISVINLLYRPNIGDTTITCSTYGQSAIPPINISASINVECE